MDNLPRRYLKKCLAYKRYWLVEPLIFFHLIANTFHSVAIETFPNTKACRVNLGQNQRICEMFYDLDNTGIFCYEYDFTKATMDGLSKVSELNESSEEFPEAICKVQHFYEELIDATTFNITSGTICIIVLLIASTWADRNNKRKICMILPIIGKLLSLGCLIMLAYSKQRFSVEFVNCVDKILPALFGCSELLFTAIYSYMIIIMSKADRLFRLGVFVMFITVINFIGKGLCTQFYKRFGYIPTFSVALGFQLIALLYIIYLIEDVVADEAKSTADIVSATDHADNSAYESVSFELTSQRHDESSKVEKLPEKRSKLLRVLDFSLVTDFLGFPFIKRENNNRWLLIILIISYFLTIGPEIGGEREMIMKQATWKAEGWNNDYLDNVEESFFVDFFTVASVISTFVGSVILSKILRVSDCTLGLLSVFFKYLSRIVYAFCDTVYFYYIAGLIDVLANVHIIAMKTIGSGIVSGTELTKLFAVFFISEIIGKHIFPLFFWEIFWTSDRSFTFFIALFHVPAIIFFVVCFILLRRKQENIANNAMENNQIDVELTDAANTDSNVIVLEPLESNQTAVTVTSRDKTDAWRNISKELAKYAGAQKGEKILENIYEDVKKKAEKEAVSEKKDGHIQYPELEEVSNSLNQIATNDRKKKFDYIQAKPSAQSKSMKTEVQISQKPMETIESSESSSEYEDVKLYNPETSEAENRIGKMEEGAELKPTKLKTKESHGVAAKHRKNKKHSTDLNAVQCMHLQNEELRAAEKHAWEKEQAERNKEKDELLIQKLKAENLIHKQM